MSDEPGYPPHALGAWGERLASRHLEGHGWRVLARNYRLGRREVDLIVRRDDLLAFVEVKTRAGAAFGTPEEAVTALKRREIEAVAEDYLARRASGDVRVRFDVVAIVVGPGRSVARITHVADAWRPSPR